MSYDDGSSSRVRSSSSLSYGRYEGVPGILIGTLGGEEEEQKKPEKNESRIDIDNLPTIEMDEVPKHTTKDDCWTVVDGLVYNLTPFVPYHPGGKKIMQGAGKESSEMFRK